METKCSWSSGSPLTPLYGDQGKRLLGIAPPVALQLFEIALDLPHPYTEGDRGYQVIVESE
jgi:hypothetical protein